MKSSKVPPKPVEYYSWLEEGEYQKNRADKYILPNNERFPDWVVQKWSKYQLSEAFQWNCDNINEGMEDLFPYQNFVKDYMNYSTPYRGLLLYYGLGSGKTRAALEIGRQYREDLDWDVVFISPASLVDNYLKEMERWGLISGDTLASIMSQRTRKARSAVLERLGYYLVSYNAPNKIAQLRHLLQPIEGQRPRLRNKVIIVDEVHNMARFIHNGLNQQKNRAKRAAALDFYNILYGATNCRFVFLSGTPIVNVPSELSILFNILRGPMRFRTNGTKPNANVPAAVRDDKNYYSVFPLNAEEFDEIFVDWSNLSIKKGQDATFKRRIMGLVSYYAGAKGDVYPSIVNSEGQPMSDEASWTLVKVPMSPFQTEVYKTARDQEILEIKRRIITKDGQGEINSMLGATQEHIDSTFRVKSRQLSNFALPTELQQIRPSSISADPEAVRLLYEEFERFASALGEDNLRNLFRGENLYKFSPKMAAMLEQIDENSSNPETDGNVLVYSNFRSIEGIEIFARVLANNGYQWFDLDDPEDLVPIGPGEQPRFAVLGRDYRTGEDNTTRILQIFNSPENNAGQIIKILLGTSNIAEGISLHNIRLVLVMEPHWNMVRINQVIGRARRICSHRTLPKDKWNFQVYVYLSVAPIAELSTDEVLYEIAIRKEIVKNQFIHLLKEAAVDCLLNASHNENILQDPPVKCLGFPARDELTYTYYPNIQNDLEKPPAQTERKVGWVPFKDIEWNKFWEKDTKKPKFAIIVDPVTKVDQLTKIRLKEDGKEYMAKALYDRASLEHSGNFVFKGYLVQGKPVWPLVKRTEAELLEEFFPK